MEFNESEKILIRKAAINARRSKHIVAILFVLLVVLAILAFLRLMTPDHFAYAAIAISMFAILKPNFALQPSYEELVRLLETKTKVEDPLLEAVKLKSLHIKP